MNLRAKSEEVIELKAELADASAKLEAALEKESYMLEKHQNEVEHKNESYNHIVRENEDRMKEITELRLKVQGLEKDLEANNVLLEREKNIYESMF